jgi:hypothetical protein
MDELKLPLLLSLSLSLYSNFSFLIFQWLFRSSHPFEHDVNAYHEVANTTLHYLLTRCEELEDLGIPGFDVHEHVCHKLLNFEKETFHLLLSLSLSLSHSHKLLSFLSLFSGWRVRIEAGYDGYLRYKQTNTKSTVVVILTCQWSQTL